MHPCLMCCIVFNAEANPQIKGAELVFVIPSPCCGSQSFDGLWVEKEKGVDALLIPSCPNGMASTKEAEGVHAGKSNATRVESARIYQRHIIEGVGLFGGGEKRAGGKSLNVLLILLEISKSRSTNSPRLTLPKLNPEAPRDVPCAWVSSLLPVLTPKTAWYHFPFCGLTTCRKEHKGEQCCVFWAVVKGGCLQGLSHRKSIQPSEHAVS